MAEPWEVEVARAAVSSRSAWGTVQESATRKEINKQEKKSVSHSQQVKLCSPTNQTLLTTQSTSSGDPEDLGLPLGIQLTPNCWPI